MQPHDHVPVSATVQQTVKNTESWEDLHNYNHICKQQEGLVKTVYTLG